MRYRFVTIEGGRGPFQVALDFDDKEGARREAMRVLSDLVREQIKAEPYRNIAIEVKDDNGRPVFQTSMIVK